MHQWLKALILLCLLVLMSCGSPTIAERDRPSAQPAAPATPIATLQSSSPMPTTRPTSTNTPATSTPHKPAEMLTTTPSGVDTGDWQTYTNDAGGYSLAIPAQWGVTGEPSASVQFFGQDTAIEDLGTGEPEFFAGGVDILGFVTTEPDPYLAALPNQSAIVEMREIETPLGAGRVYTVRRDRFKPSNDETVWYAQHALIPVDDRIYALWIRLDATTNGEPVPTLSRMIAEFRLQTGH